MCGAGGRDAGDLRQMAAAQAATERRVEQVAAGGRCLLGDERLPRGTQGREGNVEFSLPQKGFQRQTHFRFLFAFAGEYMRVMTDDQVRP